MNCLTSPHSGVCAFSLVVLRMREPSIPGNCGPKFPFCSAGNSLPFALVQRFSQARGVVRELLYLASVISPLGVITNQGWITGKMKK